ncbi:Crotonyl-CoA hydratase [Usitatibacter rugosus]|uniref:Crotonyl-CoA hydratase n=1 Tax=Usitatibacter rugosus TaxID=2732067 RepID=A0A6M4GXQ7_9PROT|nr:enoyl-CoA hydratase-related protein [Usitatibacter rugosus]QJR12079.1 Crotonyl-CoA hydratase [Usitatibacter rugosus]
MTQIARIVIDRPEAMNAMNAAVLQALLSDIEWAAADPDVRALIIVGAGDKAFSAGADIAYLNRATPMEVRELARLAVEVNHRIETLGKPVIAALNGYALGGGLELAEACAIRIAASHAVMGHPEVRIGAVAGFGGTTRLPRMVGKGRAAEMLLTGRVIDANEALAIGLVNHVVPAEELLPTAERIAMDMASCPSPAVWLTWEALHRGLNMSLEESAGLGADYFGLAASTPGFREGTSAFLRR